MIDRRGLLGMTAASLLGPAPRAIAAEGESVLRIVPQADLKILDPVWTTSQLTQAHALLVYDQLFALDSKLVPRPQMVDRWSTSADGLNWTFTLRPGLKFGDGTPVEAKDAVASLRRWAARSTDGQLLLRCTDSITADSADAFSVRLKRMFPQMLETLANATTPLFVMRETEALTDPFQQVREIVGSGPFVFVADEFREGNIVVYRKNPYANPRPEPADGMAGGKVARVDRVEWRILPDIAVAVSALRQGEVDLLENAPYDLLGLIEHDPALTLTVTDPLGQQAIIRFNQLCPPFDDLRLRQAVLHAVDRQEYLSAMVGDPRFERNCASAFICGTESESEAEGAPYGEPSLAAAQALLRASSYRGEPVVVLDPTDYGVIHAMTLVTASKLQAIGFNVDLQAMTWSQLVARRAVREAPKDGRGGWHVIHTTVPAVAMISPITNFLMATSCDGKNWFGWPCDAALEALRVSFLDATTPVEQKAVYDAMQARFWEVVPFVPVGQIIKPLVHRKSVTGLVASPITALWNVRKG
jgi:peptide/nickel transport system substrate-binding protein